MTTLFNFLTSFNSDLRFIGKKMIGHFQTKAGGYFTDSSLDKIVGTDIYFLRWVNMFLNAFAKLVNKTKGDMSKLNTPIRIPTFGFTESSATWSEGPINKLDDSVAKGAGLGILLHYIWASTIEVDNYILNSRNNTFYGDFTFTLYDDFGLDVNDIMNSKDTSPHFFLGDGFKAWWVLQRYKCYSPFITKVVVKKRISFKPNINH